MIRVIFSKLKPTFNAEEFLKLGNSCSRLQLARRTCSLPWRPRDDGRQVKLFDDTFSSVSCSNFWISLERKGMGSLYKNILSNSCSQYHINLGHISKKCNTVLFWRILQKIDTRGETFSFFYKMNIIFKRMLRYLRVYEICNFTSIMH